MAGAEDLKLHDEPSNPKPAASPSPSQPASEGSVPIQKTGEIMLGLALGIIVIVILCVIAHLLLKHHRKTHPHGGSKKKKQRKRKQKRDLEEGTVELHSVDRKVFEVAGTEVVLCELPEEAPPRQELDAGDVFPLSPLERTLTGTTGMTGTTGSETQFSPDEMVSPEDPWPERRLAVYWQSR